MDYTQSIGNVVELQCLAKFIELGYECSIPYGNNAKYDFIADINGKMLRIQCKSSSHPKKKNEEGYDETAIQFSTSSQTTNTKKTTRHSYTKEQIDYFATWYNNKVYLVPVEECSTSKTLRFAPPSGGNQNYNKAEDYEIEKIISKSNDFIKSEEQYKNRIVTQNIQQYYCFKCNTKITKYNNSNLCLNCYNETKRKTKRPNREELKKLIKNYSFKEIARQYQVSDNAIRKWCKIEKLPFKKQEINSYFSEDWEKL